MGNFLYATLKRTRLWTIISRIYVYNNKGIKRSAEKTIAKYVGKDISTKDYRRYKREIRWAFLIDHWQPSEYFTYGYRNLSKSEIRNFVTEYEKDSFCTRVNSPRAQEIIGNKCNTYEVFHEYFRRDVCEVTDFEKDRETIEEFVAKHHRFVAKPNKESIGRGICFIENGNLDAVQSLTKEYRSGLILEELIQQDATMAMFNPDSVNTVRVPTFTKDGVVHILPPIAKFGRKGVRMDHSGKGGLFASVDRKTGQLFNVLDRHLNKYAVHPDSGVKIEGFVLPQWDECLAIVRKQALVIPEAQYVGWDMAYSTKGWLLVEGNSRGQLFTQQASLRKGIKDEFLKVDPRCFD